MDAIEFLDWGVYNHFVARQRPQLVHVLQPAYYLSSYAVIGCLFLMAFGWLLLQRKVSQALVVLASLFVGWAMIEATQYLVPRHRPPDAQNWLGASAAVGSYPSSSVFLFTLAMFVIGFALWIYTPRWWIRGLYLAIAGMLTVWVCVSQFFLPLNFFSDALGGLAGAGLVGWIVCLFAPDQSSLAPASVEVHPAAQANAIQEQAKLPGGQN